MLLQLAFNNPCAAENWNPAPQPEVMLGVCAGDSRLGLRALRDWCQALNLEYVIPDCRVSQQLAAAWGVADEHMTWYHYESGMVIAV